MSKETEMEFRERIAAMKPEQFAHWANSVASLSDEELAQTDFKTLHKARDGFERRTPEQNRLGVYEHRAFTREETAKNPAVGAGLAIGAMPYYGAKFLDRAFTKENFAENPLATAALGVTAGPAYLAAKALGQTNSRSLASVDQVGNAYVGIGEGLWDRFQRAVGVPPNFVAAKATGPDMLSALSTYSDSSKGKR